MPVILRLKGFRFFFYSNEGNPLEPPHIHVRHSGKEAKFWIGVETALARNDGFDARTLRELLDLVRDHREFFEEAWNVYFS